MNFEIAKKKSEIAGNYHNQGYNCAESIFLAFRESAAPELTEDMVRIASPFGGGIGRSGCICGALSGAMIILGAAKGRTSPDISKKESYSLAGEYHNRFKNKFGSTCCRVLVKNSLSPKEQGERCYQIITESADLLMDFLTEKDIVKQNCM
jgi:C_GCAxxG_C_C family probable redox protein